MNDIMRGALVSGSLIVAIGAQNAFVLKQGLLKNNIFWVALTCFVCDFLLISLGVLGVGAMISSNTLATIILALLGGGFLAVYGVKSFMSAFFKPSTLELSQGNQTSTIMKSISVTLAITLLNPHVY